MLLVANSSLRGRAGCFSLTTSRPALTVQEGAVLVWFLLAFGYLGLQCLGVIGKLFGTNGVFLAVMLGFAAAVVLIYGTLASIAFSIGLAWIGSLLTLLMVGQLVYLGWNIYQGLG